MVSVTFLCRTSWCVIVPICSMQTAHSAQRTAYSAQRTAHSTQRTVCRQSLGGSVSCAATMWCWNHRIQCRECVEEGRSLRIVTVEFFSNLLASTDRWKASKHTEIYNEELEGWRWTNKLQLTVHMEPFAKPHCDKQPVYILRCCYRVPVTAVCRNVSSAGKRWHNWLL